jgi:hypothetical protein
LEGSQTGKTDLGRSVRIYKGLELIFIRNLVDEVEEKYQL